MFYCFFLISTQKSDPFISQLHKQGDVTDIGSYTVSVNDFTPLKEFSLIDLIIGKSTFQVTKFEGITLYFRISNFFI